MSCTITFNRMFDIDKSLKKMLNPRTSSILTPPKNSLVRSAKTSSAFSIKKKKSELLNLAKGSIFFPFTSPSVRSPSGRLLKGNAPSFNRAMKNMFGDKDRDGVPHFADNDDNNPNNPRAIHLSEKPITSYEREKIEDAVSYLKAVPPKTTPGEYPSLYVQKQREKKLRRTKSKQKRKEWMREYRRKQRGGVVSNLMGDSDKDGVNNLVDCDPDDPNKQGFIHKNFAYLYHGTKERNLDMIKKKGLQPQKNYWGPNAVFLTPAKKTALWYAKKNNPKSILKLVSGDKTKNGTKPVVLSVKVPLQDVASYSREDIEGEHPYKQIKVYRTIKPKDIKKVKHKGKDRPWEDTDNDGIINVEDCKPNDKTKQGPLHEKWLKENKTTGFAGRGIADDLYNFYNRGKPVIIFDLATVDPRIITKVKQEFPHIPVVTTFETTGGDFQQATQLVFYKPGQEQRAQEVVRLAKLVAQLNLDNKPMTPEIHREYGATLGYTEDEIAQFIKKYPEGV